MLLLPCCRQTVKLYVNKPSMTFDDTEDLPPTQVIELTGASATLPLQFVKFQCVTSLSVFIENNQADGDVTCLSKLQFVGCAPPSRSPPLPAKLAPPTARRSPAARHLPATRAARSPPDARRPPPAARRSSTAAYCIWAVTNCHPLSMALPTSPGTPPCVRSGVRLNAHGVAVRRSPRQT